MPRGALFDGTLDLLDELGVDTAEVRANDRKLLFDGRRHRDDAPVATCPPTWSTASADIGITGKDVLLEQSQRNVYELLDLGFGHCRMVVAAPEGGDPIERRAAAPGPGPHRDQVPAHRRAALRAAPAARPRSWR